MANNAVCKVCGKPYHVCPDSQRMRTWRTVACSPECYQEWLIQLENRNKKSEPAVEVIESDPEHFIVALEVEPADESEIDSPEETEE